MKSSILELMDEIEDYIDGCRYKLFSNTEIIVNKESIDELLHELRARTPDEISRYQRMLQNKEAIIADARAKADALIKEATVQTNQLVNEHEIMQVAYQRSSEIVNLATNQAQEVLDNAVTEANEVRMSAAQYMDDVLEHLNNIITSSIETTNANYETLLGDLGRYKEIIESNRRQLHQDEEAEGDSNMEVDEANLASIGDNIENEE